MQDKIKRYAEIKLEIAKLESELIELKADVSDAVFETENGELETEWGTFKLINGRKTWTYSPELTAKELQVKEMLKIKKKEEEIKGIAVLQKAPTNLVFKAK